MKISINAMQKLSKTKNSVYDVIKVEYLYHSNKLEGSTFSKENSIDLIAIDDEYNKEYREALYEAQKAGNIEPLVKVFKKCQIRLDEKLLDYNSTIKQVSEEVN